MFNQIKCLLSNNQLSLSESMYNLHYRNNFTYTLTVLMYFSRPASTIMSMKIWNFYMERMLH